MKLNQKELGSARRLIAEALKEDRVREDVTTRLLIPASRQAEAVIRAKESGVLSGVEIAREVFRKLDPKLKVQFLRRDGQTVRKNDIVLTVRGPMRAILSAERTALNFLGHLSGVATLTREFVKKAKPYKTQILDTRKTTPGFRLLEKYAVRCGGGVNHRSSLADSIFIKDNHWQFINSLFSPSPIKGEGAAVPLPLRERLGGGGQELIIEVETERQLKRALTLKPDVILFDNKTPQALRKLCRKVRGMKLRPRPQLEVSGGITLANVRAYAASGVDRISAGALTHSARSRNFSLGIL